MLEKINQIFGNIKDAIQEKGIEISDCESPENYADRIMQINVCSDDDCSGEGGEGGTSNNGYVYFFFPAFIASKTQPDTPNNTIRSLFTVTSGNYIQTLNYPAGWGSATTVMSGNKENPVWISYCIVAIKNNSPSYYLNWTIPMCIGYPYTNPSSDQWIDDGGEHTGNNYYTRTFLIYTELPSTSYSLSTPVGGIWNTTTNLLEGSITSTTSTGTVTWSVNNNHTSGMYTYISIGTFGSDGNIIGTWSDPFCINATNGKDGKDGADGRSGVDGVNVEFIYKLCTDLEAFRLLETPDSQPYTGYIPTGWTAVPSGIDCSNYKVEACCIRKLESNGRWGTWNGPIIWAICGGSGSGDGSGSGSGGGSGIVNDVEYWYRLDTRSTGVTPPPLGVEPNSAAVQGGPWSKTQSNPTSSWPYLWCFIQIRTSRSLSNGGWNYARSNAFIVRQWNAEISDAFDSFNRELEQAREQLLEYVSGIEIDYLKVNESLNDFRAKIESELLKENINEAFNRINNIDGTGTTIDSKDGLWNLMTSYDGTETDGTNKKAFADFVADAENAMVGISTGTSLHNQLTSANLTVSALLEKINASVTQHDLESIVAGSQMEMQPNLISAIVSKGQCFWEKDDVLYPYNHHLSDFINSYTGDSGQILSAYEAYMAKTSEQDGPSDGPFTLTTVVSEFSSIKMTSNEIKSDVQKSIFAWKKREDITINKPYPNIVKYDYFTNGYNNRGTAYQSYEYDDYVRVYYHYDKVRVGEELSNISQSVDDITLEVGNVHKLWRKEKTDGSYEYEQYAIPENTTQTTYESSKRSDGYELITYSDALGAIDITEDAINLTVKKQTCFWTDNAEQNPQYLTYDNWYSDWEDVKPSHPDDDRYSTYEKYVYNFKTFNNGTGHYQLVQVNTAVSGLKIEADQISSRITNMNDDISEISQSVNDIKLLVGADAKVWYMSELEGSQEQVYNKTYYPGGIYAYKTLWNEYLTATSTSEENATESAYEAWFTNLLDGLNPILKNERQIGAISLENNNVLLGVGYGNGQYLSSIKVQQDQNNPDLGKIVLDAANTVVNGNLSAGIVESAFGNFNTLTTTKAAIQQLVASSVTANRLESIDEGNTRRVLIENGKAEFYLWDSTMNSGNGGWRKRIDIGITGTSNNDLVLRFFDSTTGEELYNLGPAGLKASPIGGNVIVTDQYGDWEFS